MGARDDEVARTVDGIIEELKKRQFCDISQLSQFLSQSADRIRYEKPVSEITVGREVAPVIQG